MTQKEVQQIIMLARRAPLANMAEAEIAAELLAKLSAHFAPKPADTGSAASRIHPADNGPAPAPAP